MSRSIKGPPQLPAINKNLYNQGSATGANTAGVTYPDTIECYVCKRSKPHDAYSKRQLLGWRNTIYQPWAPGGRVKANPHTTCKLCTQAQTTELTCCVCGETKGLDKFSKVQRKAPDRARCKKCIDFHADVDPDLEVPDIDEYYTSDEENEESEDDFDNPGMKKEENLKSVPGSAVGKNVNASNNQQSLASTMSKMKIKDEQDEWESVPPSTTTKDSKYAGPSTQSYSGVASTSYAQSASRSGYSVQVKKEQLQVGKSGWAKVKKVPQKQTNDDEDDEWADTKRRPKKKADVEVDPWDAIYS